MQDKNFIKSIFRNGPSDLQIRKPAVLLSGNGVNRIIFLSTPTPALVASIINGKYTNALPLERQSKAFKTNGIQLSTNTMANWVIRSTDVYLSLIYDRLHELIYDSKVIHADESPVKVIRIDHAKIKNGKKTYMWVYRNRPLRGTHPIVLLDWQPSRHSDHPREFLKTFSGTVITDGYQVYHKLAKERRDWCGIKKVDILFSRIS